MPKISIIMPSLNMRKYISECMESVIDQTLDDIEIICVDAGSADGTVEILNEFAEKDRRIKIIHSDKRSYGYQMNLGIKAAAGKYIGIVETDDTVEREMFETLYNCAEENNADFVKSDFTVFTEFSGGEQYRMRYSLKKKHNIPYDRIFSHYDYASRKNSIDTFIWNGIYKREFLIGNNIKFNESSGAAFQDCGFRCGTALTAERGFFIDKPLYNYRRSNIFSSTYNDRSVFFNLAESEYVLKWMKDNGITDKAGLSFIAREIVLIAIIPYMDTMVWKDISQASAEALDKFRVLINRLREQGLLERHEMFDDLFFLMRMFTEAPEHFEYYVRLKADILRNDLIRFLERVKKYKSIVIFGCGQAGEAALCLCRSNGIGNIVSVCDNDEKKHGKKFGSYGIVSPEEAVRAYPEGGYLIANMGHSGEIKKQLMEYGTPEENIFTYDLPADPLFCTNILLRN